MFDRAGKLVRSRLAEAISAAGNLSPRQFGLDVIMEVMDSEEVFARQ